MASVRSNKRSNVSARAEHDKALPVKVPQLLITLDNVGLECPVTMNGHALSGSAACQSRSRSLDDYAEDTLPDLAGAFDVSCPDRLILCGTAPHIFFW